jgi:hypothetical protein
MPGKRRLGADPFAVHCPQCSVLPEQRCVAEDGVQRRTAHARRVQLAYALTTGEDCRGREAADVYRMWFPDVDVARITCAPSRSQYRWRSRWSVVWRRCWRNEDEAEAAYQAEQGCGCTSFGDDETPAIEVLEEQLALGPGESQENLLDAITQAQQREQVRRSQRDI